MCACGIDIGTMFLTKAELSSEGNVLFTTERNCFLQASSLEETEETLREQGWSFIKNGNDYYILGEDAIKLKNLLTVQGDSSIIVTKVGELRRPMKDGLLNTSEEKLSVAIIQKIIANLLGSPKYPGEVLCFCAPGDPIDRSLTSVFHKTMLSSFLSGLGYTVECIPEALAIIFSERPVAIDEEGEQPYSGIGISLGSGMVNVCFAFKKIPLINFSIARSGDFIDQQAAQTSGCSVSAITKFKETKFDLSNVDYSDMKQAALDIYYQNMIQYAVSNFVEKFKKLDSTIDSPLEIVIAGGTASVPGFLDKFKSVIKDIDLPFKIKTIRMAESPRFAVANGCLAKSIAVESKIKKTENKKVDELLTSIQNEESEGETKKIKIPNRRG